MRATAATRLPSSEVKISDEKPMTVPASRPTMAAPQSLSSNWKIRLAPSVKSKNRAVVKYVPRLSALPRLLPSFTLEMKTPTMEANRPMAEAMKMKGACLRSSARTSEAAMAATFESKRSAPIPATSPTLSPTLSAMTAGFLGSSSGMPSSTLPVKSAAMSAVLVKMPPPALAKSASELAPKLKASKKFGS